MQPISLKDSQNQEFKGKKWKRTCSLKCEELLTGRQWVINAFESGLFPMKNMDITDDDDDDDDDDDYFIYDDEFYTTNPSPILGPSPGR